MKNVIMFIGLMIVCTGCGDGLHLVEKPQNCTTVQTTNGVNIVCPDSTTFVSNGADGSQGIPGLQGSDGVNGTNGSNGVDATPVTMVQFCTNQQTVFPSNFAEFGFCVAGKLYATFWDGHNAWTAEIVPGVYTSTSTSAPCNFKVVEHCGIQRL